MGAEKDQKSPAPGTFSTDAQAEYKAATQGIEFTKDFNPALEALMMDGTATYGQRFLAWLKRRSWGNYRLYAIRDDGEPATQADAARDLNIDKRRLSKVVAFYEQRGYLYREGRMLYPTLAPKVAPLSPDLLLKVAGASDFSEFLENWKVACSADFSELEVARSTVERLRKVQIAAYKEWKASRTNGVPTLYKNGEDIEEEDPPSSSSSLSEPPETTTTTNGYSEHVEKETPLPSDPPPALETTAVREALQKHGAADAQAVDTLIAKCRENKPDATDAEICRAIDLKGPISKGKRNPIGFLLTAVANCFAGGESPPLQVAAAAGAETDDQRKEREFWEAMERRKPKPCPNT